MISVIILCVVALICLICACISGWLIKTPRDGGIYFIICAVCTIAFFICIVHAVNKADLYEKTQHDHQHIEQKR